MDDAAPTTSLPDDPVQLKALLAQRDEQLAQRERRIADQQAAIAQITQQRDTFYLEKLRLEVRLAQALKQAYGPRADRLRDPGQFLLEFGRQLEQLPIDAPEAQAAAPEEGASPAPQPPATRRLRTRGRRDIGSLDHLPQIEQVYELTGELCRCPACRAERIKIGSEVSYTIEHIPASLLRVKHVQHKYACPACEACGDNPNITLAAKTKGSPIDKGLPGPGLLAYVATAKFSDYLPLNRLQTIFAREGFELDRSTLCLWMADVAQLVRPLYRRMVERVKQSHVLATDDTVMPLPARMWIYQGDESRPYNVFDFTLSRARDGPAQFLRDFRGTLLADAYGGYDGIVVNQELPRAGCWSHARRKFVDAAPAAPETTHAIVALLNRLFKTEARINDELEAQRGDEAKTQHDDGPRCGDAALETGLPQGIERVAAERLRRRQVEARPIIDALHALLLDQKQRLLPKHPLAQAIQYTLNQWRELTLFLADGAVPIHNNLAEQQMKRIALLRKNALFVATPRGGETAAILSTLTSTCRRHAINPQAYLTQLLTNLPNTPISQLDPWLPASGRPPRNLRARHRRNNRRHPSPAERDAVHSTDTTL